MTAAATQPRKALRAMLRNSTRGVAGYAIGYGLKLGYWPCLRAPFIQISFNRWVFEVWYGLPSYKEGGAP